ncbi:hypothetical protein TSUD_25770 [Trifolium subterraneum]|uniref:Uncharacterized protein n=1 Tax=Trifolium subterraneum TaxID=3900 RepID=A0A2Z6NKI1_TRISU|nr:hypothetical protein TSUD_25770 [Trifolium subterraneum]
MILEHRGADLKIVGIDNVASSEGERTEPNVDETVGIGMGYAWVTAISRTEILVHSFFFFFSLISLLTLSTQPALSRLFLLSTPM